MTGGERLFEIGAMSWRSQTGHLSISMSDEAGIVEIIFDTPVSFRSQDEGDMLEFWGARGAEDIEVATVYTIEQSDYLASFAGNSVSSFTCNLRHWLIAGNNQCVEVIADAEDHPIIRELERFQEK